MSSTTKTVSVAGATGFVGRWIVDELIHAGHHVRALVRDAEKAREVLPVQEAGERLTLVRSGDDSASLDSWRELVRECDAHIQLVGIIREAGKGQTFQNVHVRLTELALEACRAEGVHRYLHMSAIGVGSEGKTGYQKTKWEGEQLVRRSGLEWTIFRCSLIHGVDGEAMTQFASLAAGAEAPWLFIPYFQRWHEDKTVPLGALNPVDPMIQPVAVQDVATVFVKALGLPQTIGEIYNVVGADAMSWPEMLVEIRDRVPNGQRSLQPFPVPATVAAGIALAAKAIGLGSLLPFDAGMALMGGEDSVASLDKLQADFGFTPRGFRESFAEYAREL
ncbi:MAG: NAD(P)H-binding protein [Planctomycetota bacterium]|nr:NAD(P)H-binding protein [Planctomycetota bacterium]